MDLESRRKRNGCRRGQTSDEIRVLLSADEVGEWRCLIVGHPDEDKRLPRRRLRGLQSSRDLSSSLHP